MSEVFARVVTECLHASGIASVGAPGSTALHVWIALRGLSGALTRRRPHDGGLDDGDVSRFVEEYVCMLLRGLASDAANDATRGLARWSRG